MKSFLSVPLLLLLPVVAFASSSHPPTVAFAASSSTHNNNNNNSNDNKRKKSRAAKAKRPSQKTKKLNHKASGGFGKKESPVVSSVALEDDSRNEELAKQTVRNLFSVTSHIQDPQLYQPKWANSCTLMSPDQDSDGTVSLVASKDVSKGEILTLFPIHALGLRTLGGSSSSSSDNTDTEFIAYDLDRDGGYFQEENPTAGLRMKLNIPLDETQPAASSIYLRDGDRKRKVLFAMTFRDEIVPGWMGSRVKSTGIPAKANCITMPLPGAAPLCAVVATDDIVEGSELLQAMPKGNVLEECKQLLRSTYPSELAELNGYINMACGIQPIDGATVASENLDSTTSSEVVDQTSKAAQEEQLSSRSLGPFHEINKEYPGLRQIHHDPDVFVVDNFLTADECDRIVSKTTAHLRPCLIKNESTGEVQNNPSRTSTDANLPQAEAPTIVNKLTSLVKCDPSQLEILQVLRYLWGQEFKPHTDGYSGPVSACGFEESNRIVTVFTYLNDVAGGGTTYFKDIDLEIRPEKGMAVVHFPSDLALREDGRYLVIERSVVYILSGDSVTYLLRNIMSSCRTNHPPRNACN